MPIAIERTRWSRLIGAHAGRLPLETLPSNESDDSAHKEEPTIHGWKVIDLIDDIVETFKFRWEEI